MASPGGAAGGLYATFEGVGQIFYTFLIGGQRATLPKLRTHRVVVGGILSVGVAGVLSALILPLAMDGAQSVPVAQRAAGGGLLGALAGLVLAMILEGYVSSLEYDEREEKRRAELIAQGLDPDKKCFVATAVFDSPDSPEVLALRAWRDRYLLHHTTGRWAVKWYYTLSPRLADSIRRRPRLRIVVKKCLVGFLGVLRRDGHV
jgi:hypothetical protein